MIMLGLVFICRSQQADHNKHNTLDVLCVLQCTLLHAHRANAFAISMPATATTAHTRTVLWTTNGSHDLMVSTSLSSTGKLAWTAMAPITVPTVLWQPSQLT